MKQPCMAAAAMPKTPQTAGELPLMCRRNRVPECFVQHACTCLPAKEIITHMISMLPAQPPSAHQHSVPVFERPALQEREREVISMSGSCAVNAICFRKLCSQQHQPHLQGHQQTEWWSCRSGVACSVTGVGESIMRAGLAKAVCTQMLNTPAKAVDDTCEASIRDNILEGQPAAIPCPHKDCGILAVRVNAAGGYLMMRAVQFDGSQAVLWGNQHVWGDNKQ